MMFTRSRCGLVLSLTNLKLPALMTFSPTDQRMMREAISLSRRGEGRVEPNPMVGCVLARGDEIVGRGWHDVFGGPHAEVNAIANARKLGVDQFDDVTAFVTLEPCSHHGKTPPCCDALIDAGVARVVIAVGDPSNQVNGRGMSRLVEAGVTVESGLMAEEASEVLAPFLKAVNQQLPWVIAKWAMTIDGKIATASGNSQWISGEQSRAVVHAIRGRVDAIMVGSTTARIDDPLLTVRPPGMRTPIRVVFDSAGKLSPTSKLATTARETRVLIGVGPQCDQDNLAKLRDAGCEIIELIGIDHSQRLQELLEALSRMNVTNLLVEGGSGLLGGLHDLGQIDEAHVFIAPKLLGGRGAVTAVAGDDRATISLSTTMQLVSTDTLDDDVYLQYRRT